MGLPSAHELRTAIESAGWQIKHWSDVRAGTERTQHGYRSRLRGLGDAIRADGDTQLSLLKQLTQHPTNATATWQVRRRSIHQLSTSGPSACGVVFWASGRPFGVILTDGVLLV